MCNQSKQLLSQSEPREKVEGILDQLAAYTCEHFSREESVMEACDYPNLEDHKRVHSMMVSKLKDLRQQFSKDQLSPDALFNFTKDWWIDHIITMDLAMAEYCDNELDPSNK